MKKCLWLVLTLAMVLLPVVGWSSPFLYCDPQPNTVIDYSVSLDGGAAVLVDATPIGTTGQVQLKYALAGVSAAAHTMTVKSVTVWGESAPVNFTFTKSASPVPVNLRVAQ